MCRPIRHDRVERRHRVLEHHRDLARPRTCAGSRGDQGAQVGAVEHDTLAGVIVADAG